MTDVLHADDTLYEELYDVRREAEHAGNFVEEDMNPPMNALRDKAPVQKGFLRELLGLPPHHRHGASVGRDGYTSFNFETCNAAFRDYERLSNHIMNVGPPSDEPMLGILAMDEPIHRSYRATIQPMFLKPKAFTWWRTRWIDEMVEALVDRLKKQDRAELNLQLCARIPVHTITRAVGMEGDDALTFRNALVRGSATGRVTPQTMMESYATVARMLSELIAARRVEPRDDLVSALIAEELELPDGAKRPLTDNEIATHCRLVLLAGGGTSWRQMGITFWALLTHPEQLEAVRADRSLMERAVDEGARWNPTDPVFSRLVSQDHELGGVHLPAGGVLEICLAAANRDPARWDNPDAYDLHRRPQAHLGFGVGPHQCLGMNVGKAEIMSAVGAMLDAFPNLRLDPDEPAPFLTGGLEQRGMSAIPVLLK